jgi:tRNA-dihydrouridine synthase
MKNYLDQLPRPFIVLAPMDDVTDTVFRRFVARLGPADLYMTEFVNADGLQSPGKRSLMKKLRFTAEEQPLIAQIWGRNPENFYKTTKELIKMGFVGVDLNMGCPDKAVLKNGCGGGMIERPEQAIEIIKATQEAAQGKIPVSVKTRIGFREFDENWLKTVLSQKLNMLSVHLRTVRELSKVDAHWELMPRIKALRDEVSPTTALVGNGDVEGRKQAEELAAKYGIDGVMIGRGIFHNPFACGDEASWPTMRPEEKLDLYRQHIELFEETWQEGERPVVTLNKFCKIYVNDFDGAKDMRMRLMQARSLPELKHTLHKDQQTLSSSIIMK